MDFELKHLEILPGDSEESRHSIQKTTSTPPKFRPTLSASHSQGVSQNSLVVEDLTQQIEDLQNRLKVNYKKMVIYEAENQKLIQEKNSLFFENKELAEKSDLVTEKNKKLLSYSNELEIEVDKLTYQNEASLKLIETQKIDLNRLTKFHLKIKNVIKPYVENLKQKISELNMLATQQVKIINSNENMIRNLENEIESQKSKFESTTQQNNREKNMLIQGYEEQIHFLSKEIVAEQEKTLDLQNENLKLKKQLETKHFIENELIRFKRSHDDQLQSIHTLKLKVHELEEEIMLMKSNENDLKLENNKLVTSNEQLQSVLDSTRVQLNTKLNELETLSLRLKMFEKLNTNLSLNLKDFQG